MMCISQITTGSGSLSVQWCEEVFQFKIIEFQLITFIDPIAPSTHPPTHWLRATIRPMAVVIAFTAVVVAYRSNNAAKLDDVFFLKLFLFRVNSHIMLVYEVRLSEFSWQV